MKRDLDLARQLLLEIEDHGANCPLTDLTHAGEADERVRHHVRLLVDDGLLKEAERTSDGVPCVRLTNEGHEFLEIAGSEALWRDAKWLVQERTGALSFRAVRDLLARWAAEATLGDAPYRADVRAIAPAYVPLRRVESPYVDLHYAPGPYTAPRYAAARYVEPRYAEASFVAPRYAAARYVEPRAYDAAYRWREPLPRYTPGALRRHATRADVRPTPLDWRDRRDREAFVNDLYAPRYATNRYRDAVYAEVAESPRSLDGYDRVVYRDRAYRDRDYRGAYGVEWVGAVDEYGASLPVHVV
jgi:hypothetical protein